MVWVATRAAGLSVCSMHPPQARRRLISSSSARTVPPPRYALVVEPEGRWPDAAGDHLARAVDRQIVGLNEEYLRKRATGRLGPIDVVRVELGTSRTAARCP
jgi:hypothetical protein